jgi:hypothetical protein
VLLRCRKNGGVTKFEKCKAAFARRKSQARGPNVTHIFKVPKPSIFNSSFQFFFIDTSMTVSSHFIRTLHSSILRCYLYSSFFYLTKFQTSSLSIKKEATLLLSTPIITKQQ